MNSIVISFLIILISILIICEFNLISFLSLILVFILNLFIVSKFNSKYKQSDEKLDNNCKLNDENINNYNNYKIFYFVVKPFIYFKQIFSDFIIQKLLNVLIKLENNLKEKSVCGQTLDIKNEFKEISEIITDNYIDFWYESIGSDNKDFENECRLILEKMFLNLFERSERKVNKHLFFQKLLFLLERHLNDTKYPKDLSSLDFNENERIDSIVERLIGLTATEEIASVLSNRSHNKESKNLCLVLMIKAMLSHSVFLPIINIIAEKKFIYENLFYLITNSELKLKDNKTEKQLLNITLNNECLESRDQIQIIDSTDCQSINDKKFFKQFSNNSDDDILKSSEFYDLSENESNDELIVEALEADEDIDEKLISNLLITKTEEINDLYKSSYILYYIEYEGLFQETNDLSFRGPIFSNKPKHFFRKRVSVKRRFSEFIVLQKVLERNKSFKLLMRGIKKPTAIQITAQNLLLFAGSNNTKLDSSTLEFRRIYLQNFLIQLCNLKFIVESLELQQFLGYGSDGRITFVANHFDNQNNNLSLNIDKVLFRGVKGALSIMKSALPIEPQTGKIDPKFSERIITENENLSIKSIVTKFESNNCMQLEKKLNIYLESGSQHNIIEYFDPNEDITIKNNSNKTLGTRTLGDGCETPTTFEINSNIYSKTYTNNNNELNQSKLSDTIHTINCFLILITNNIGLIEKIIFTKIISIIFGTIIEKFITILISKLITKEMFIRYIHSLHLALWPTNKTRVQNECEVQNTDILNQTVNALYIYILCKFDSYFPNFSYVLNSLPTFKLLENVLAKFENINKNKLFLYEFCELFLNEIQ